jgi:hypothetical protein
MRRKPFPATKMLFNFDLWQHSTAIAPSAKHLLAAIQILYCRMSASAVRCRRAEALRCTQEGADAGLDDRGHFFGHPALTVTIFHAGVAAGRVQ